MTIHLISDQSSLAVASFLVDYAKKFFASTTKFQLVPQQADDQELWSWEELFAVGRSVKPKKRKGAAEDYVVVLVSGENEHNWFAAFDQEDPSLGFLQVTGWELFGLNRPVYAVAYHLVALITSMKFFGNDPNPLSFYHGTSLGCMFDFTEYKEEVLYKLKSAHICPECMNALAQKSGGTAQAFTFLKGVKEVLEHVREMLFKEDWSLFFEKFDYRLMVKEDFSLELEVNGELIPLDLGKGRESVAFMMLLKHQNGLSYNDFIQPRFKKEYVGLYYRYFANSGSYESLMRQADLEIEQKTYKKNLYATICKIKTKLSNTLKQYPDIKKQLLIQGGKGPLTIPINRKRVHSSLPELQLVG